MSRPTQSDSIAISNPVDDGLSLERKLGKTPSPEYTFLKMYTMGSQMKAKHRPPSLRWITNAVIEVVDPWLTMRSYFFHWKPVGRIAAARRYVEK
jgi:hypothetical protein